jgi:hypothetical protein
MTSNFVVMPLSSNAAALSGQEPAAWSAPVAPVTPTVSAQVQ